MAGLPDGFVIQLNKKVRVSDGGRTLVGGSPTRALFLKETATGLIAGRQLRVTDRATRGLADRLLDAGMADPVLDKLPDVAEPRSVTFVVPVWGRPDSLDRLLTSIGTASPIIVVDDRSPDTVAIERVAATHGARYVLLPENVGPAGARNAGLVLVTTQFVAFVDSDVVTDPATLTRLLKHFADPAVALAAPRVLGLIGEAPLNWIGRYEEARSSLDLGRAAAMVRPRSPVSWVPSTFVVARVAAIGDGFSPTMREGEDVDLMWRLAESGWRVRYEPAAHVWHDHRVTVDGWLSRKAFYGSSAHPLSQRHPHNIAPAVLAPWSVGMLAALLAQRRWSIPVAALISVGAAARIAYKLRRGRHPWTMSARLTASGVGAALSQLMALLVRHWWPVTVLSCVVSRRARRAAMAAAVIDAGIEYVRTKPRLDPFRFAVARRLDDLAYGFGVWRSAVKGRSPAALLPDLRRRRKSGLS